MSRLVILAWLWGILSFQPNRLSAAWAKVPIIDVPERISGIAIGRLDGAETLVIAHGRRLDMIRWSGGGWVVSNINLITGIESVVSDRSSLWAPLYSGIRFSSLDQPQWPPAGIGAALDFKDSCPSVISIIPGGAADRDGRLKINDKIEAIAQSGDSFVASCGIEGASVIQMIRGQKGTTVRLRVIPATDPNSRAEIDIVRANLKVERPAGSASPGSESASAFKSHSGIRAAHTPLAISPARTDGVNRLYVASAIGEELLELTPQSPAQSQRWTIDRIHMPGIGTDAMQATVSRIDGKARIFANRVFEGPIVSTDTTCGHSTKHFKLYECTWSGQWECNKISEPCPGPFVTNPRGERNYDVILGLHKILTRKAGAGWTSIGRFSGIHYMVSSLEMDDAIYTDDRLVRFRDDFGRHSVTSIGDIPGNLVSLAPAQIGADAKERAYMGGDDWHVYETMVSTAGPILRDIGKARGIPWQILPGDLRNTGHHHLYVSEERGGSFGGSGTTITEYTHFPDRSAVAVLGFDIENSSSDAVSQDGAGGVLGNLLRSELGRFEHLDIIETDNIDRVQSEREFQRAQCSEDSCLAKIGAILHAQSLVKGRINRENGGIVISLRVIDVHSGETILDRTRMVEAEIQIPVAIALLARTCALEWPLLAN